VSILMKRHASAMVSGFLFAALGLPMVCCGQISTGSNGSDGAFSPATNVMINMADHPNGVYQYTSVNISNSVTVTFVPNASNTAVVWLVQSNVVIAGFVDVSGQNCGNTTVGGTGGPGGYRAGNGGSSLTGGQGPGGGQAGSFGANASFGDYGLTNDSGIAPGPVYGNSYVVPLVGGSGGGGATAYSGVGGGGGGGAISIAASGTIDVAFSGGILANGGACGFGSGNNPHPAGGGSGGAVRLVASKITGSGVIQARGGAGSGSVQPGWPGYGYGGTGRIRLDTYENDFGGATVGVFTQGAQFVILPSSGQLPQLAVTSIAGVPVSVSPTGVLNTPDAVLSAQQTNPVPIVVHCSNVPLGTAITVSVKLVGGAAVTGVGYNSGSVSSSTVTVSIVIPRGGGLVYATATTSN
jgi:hypothetical protein